MLGDSIMITAKFAELITFIASCNGTGKREIEKRVELGELTAEEAAYILFHATAKKIHDRLESMEAKASALSC
jgi:3-oxoacyl-(acyl-carrier-protein) synthase